ncbi:MAG: ABC transporter substrate-binding protein [Phycisphaerales bacterium]|nr:ABC transporter substrate-binding protein [Phycisphaerales bacterium]
MKYVSLFLIFLMLSGCGKGPSDPSATSTGGQTPVKLILNWKPEPEFGGFYEARDKGLYKNHGLNVTIESAPEHVTQLVAAGKTQFGIMAADEIVTARSQGIDIVALFAVYQTNPQGIMTHASRGLKEIGDVLRNPGTLAVQPGLAYVNYLEKKYAPVRVQVVPYDYSIVRFMASPDFSQQCFITAEPLAAKKQGADPRVFLIADSGFNPYAGIVVTRGDYLKNNRKTVENFIAATRDGWQNYLDDPMAANATMGQLNKEMDARTFADAAEAQKPLIETDETREHGLGTMSNERWQTLIGQLQQLKKISSPPPAGECFVNP